VVIALAFLIIFWLGSSSTPRPTPAIEPSPLTDPAVQRALLGFAVLVLATLLLVLMHDVGKVALSGQSLAHRRNIMFAFALLLLAETFAIDIGATLGIQTSKVKGVPAAGLNSFALGILGFFLLYSAVEYAFTFSADYLRSRSDWNRSESVTQGLAVTIIGLYRVLFDITLPALAVAYVVTFFGGETRAFVLTAKNAVACKHPDVVLVREASLQRIDSTLTRLERGYPDARPALYDIRSAVRTVDSLASGAEISAWFRCSRVSPTDR
jgi:hypothetical protein